MLSLRKSLKYILKELNTIKGEFRYSTEETFTGHYWIDGKPIYRRVFTGLSYGQTTSTWTATGATISDVDTLINGISLRSDKTIAFLAFRMNGDSVTYYTSVSWTALTGIILEYTKTTD